MSTQHQSTQYKMATPAQRKAVFGNRAETLRHVIVLIDQEAIQIQDTDWMIRCCLHVPDSAAATLVFDWMHTAPETVWRVPEVQDIRSSSTHRGSPNPAADLSGGPSTAAQLFFGY